ncbi:MAG: hypothetical protein IJZ96_04485 [Lachnospiraceae bacterium]|nr:hypothetical protein [Lachnospiraceae bacterium]
MKKKRNIKDIIWTIILVVLVIIMLLAIPLYDKSMCLAKLVENKAYYVNHLWPKLYTHVNIFFIIPLITATFYHSERIMDLDEKVGAKEELAIKNSALGMISALGVTYTLVCTFGLKLFNLSVIAFVAVVIFAIISIRQNYKEYKDIDEDVTIDDIWGGVGMRLNIWLVIIVVLGLLLFNTMAKNAFLAREEYIELSKAKVELCFGHIQDFEENRATVKVEFVNLYGDSDREYTLEQLEQEYTNFKTGKGSWSNLWYFCEESIDVELATQSSIPELDSRLLYDEKNYYLEKYYYPEAGYMDTVEENKARDDKLYDIVYFAVCVEEELNLKGLTLRQLNDSADLNEDLSDFLELEYESATTEQVVEACHNFAAKKEPVDGAAPIMSQVDSLKIYMNISPGQRISEVELRETNGFEIDRIDWFYEVGADSYSYVNSESRLLDDGEYMISLYFKIPLAYDVSDDLKVYLKGVNKQDVEIDEDFDGELNEIKVDIKLDVADVEELTYKGVEIGLESTEPGTDVVDCKGWDESRVCDSEYIGWKVYDITTGQATDYEEEEFSGDNLCYIATIKVTPEKGITFDDVEVVYHGSKISIYEYDSTLHDYKAGEYPKPYFERVNENGEEYILAYVPYFMAYTTGEYGDLWNQFNYTNYVYLPEGAGFGIYQRPNLGYDYVKNGVTDFDGNEIDVEKSSATDITIYMPGEPIIVTGYFEPEK